jgi:hypothetical protein
VQKLREALAELAACDVVTLPDQQVRDELLGCIGCANSVQALVASRLDVFDTRELAELDGFRTARAWLRGFGRLSPVPPPGCTSGRGYCGRCRRCGRPPSMAPSRPTMWTRWHDLTDRVDLEQVKAYDIILAELSATAGPDETKRACERIAAYHDPDGADPDPEADFRTANPVRVPVRRYDVPQGPVRRRRRRRAARGAGRHHATPAQDDPRDAGQRRADAMIDLCRATLAGGELSTVHGVRPQIGLLMTPEQLTGLTTVGTGPVAATGGVFDQALGAATNPLARVAGPLAAPADALAAAGVPPVDRPWLDWVGPVSPATARRIACDAEFFRIVLDPRNGLPLDVGSAYRIVPPWIRKAVLARDRTCRWPGCDAPRAWLDIHHVMPWAIYHRTTVDECLALCRFHHVRVHDCGWGLEFDVRSGQVTITRPDGRPYELGPSQPWTPSADGPTTHGATGRPTTGGPTIPRPRPPGDHGSDADVQASDEATGPPGPSSS